VEKNTVVAETQWSVGVSIPEKTAEPKAVIPEELMPEEEIPEVEAEAQVSSEAPPSSQESPTPSQAEVTPPSVPHTTTNKPTSPPISMKQGASSRPFGKEQPSEEEGEEEEEAMEAPELEDIEWRPVTDLVKQYGEPFHLKRRPKVRRREEYEEEVEFEEVRPRPKKKSYLPYVAIGLLAVAAVAYFLHRRQRASLHPSSGSPLGVPTNVTPVAPSVSPTPPPTSQQSTPKSSPSQSEKPTTTPIVADWSEKLRII
jgi:cytoskeletal protein RodZ